MVRTKRVETAPGWSESLQSMGRCDPTGWSESLHPRARVATNAESTHNAHHSTHGAHQSTRCARLDARRARIDKRRAPIDAPDVRLAGKAMSYIVQLAAIEHVEWSIRTATVVTFGEGVEPLELGRLPGTRLREILGDNA